MLCLSGFDLYSRWVPLFTVGRNLIIYVINFTLSSVTRTTRVSVDTLVCAIDFADNALL